MKMLNFTFIQYFSGMIRIILNFCLVGFFVYVLSKALKDSSHSQQWSSTTGVILDSNVVQGRVLGSRTTEYPRVLYQYEVQNRTFRSERIYPGKPIGGWLMARKVQHYPVGQRVTVFYNPMNPMEAVLEKKPPTHVPLLIFLFMLIFILMQLVSFVPAFFH